MARFDSWCPELEAAIAAPFPERVMRTRKVPGSGSMPFVPWEAYVYRLNSLVGPQGWSQDDPMIHIIGGKLVMGVPITILGVRKVNFGSEQADHGEPAEVPDGKGGKKEVVRDFGSAETNAFAQGLKRTLALFGMGLSQYDKDGHAAAMARDEEAADLTRMIAFLREVGPNLEPSAEGRIACETVVLQSSIQQRWRSIRGDLVLARAYVREVEWATNVTMDEFTAARRAAPRAATATKREEAAR